MSPKAIRSSFHVNALSVQKERLKRTTESNNEKCEDNFVLDKMSFTMFPKEFSEGGR